MSAETKTAYEWAALSDYRRSVENLDVIGSELEGVAAELESLQTLDRLPPEVPVDASIEKIREALGNIEQVKTELVSKVASFENTVMNQENI